METTEKQQRELEIAVLESFVCQCADKAPDGCTSENYLYLTGKTINDICSLISFGATDTIDVMDVRNVLCRLSHSKSLPRIVDFGTTLFTHQAYIAVYLPYIEQCKRQ